MELGSTADDDGSGNRGNGDDSGECESANTDTGWRDGCEGGCDNKVDGGVGIYSLIRERLGQDREKMGHDSFLVGRVVDVNFDV